MKGKKERHNLQFLSVEADRADSKAGRIDNHALVHDNAIPIHRGGEAKNTPWLDVPNNMNIAGLRLRRSRQLNARRRSFPSVIDFV